MSTFSMAYSVCADADRINIYREASLRKTGGGLSAEHGLFATAEWWEALQFGRIPTRMRFVSVVRIEPYKTRGFPEIYFVDSDGTSGSCAMYGPEDDYKPGVKLVILESYAVSRPFVNAVSPQSSEMWLVLEIWIAT